MAGSKEALVIILDAGPAMWQAEEEASPFQKAKHCVNMILQRKIFSESKDELALVVFGSPETSNSLAEEYQDQYQNISVEQELGPVGWQFLDLVEKLQPSTVPGDFIDALVVAMDILVNQTKGQKFGGGLRILLFSTFGHEFCEDKIQDIVQGLKKTEMALTVIGPDLDHAKTDGELMIRDILQQADGESCTFSEAASTLRHFQTRKVNPTAWKASLEIGSLRIPIAAYVHVTQVKTRSWRPVCARDPRASLVRAVSYHLPDEDQTEVEQDKIIQGFRYGATLVPFNKEDKKTLSYVPGEKGIKILGFTKMEHIKRQYLIGDRTSRVVAGDKAADEALAALIQALHQTDCAAVGRYVYSARCQPYLVLLCPLIKADYQCLSMIRLPYAEDVRHYPFLPLAPPSEDQISGMEELVAAMDLGSGDDELLKSRHTPNPQIQRLYQCLQFRAFKGDLPLPDPPSPIADILARTVEPSPELLNRLKSLFPLQEIAIKKGPKTAAAFFHNGELRQTEDGAGDSAAAAQEVGTVTPSQDFLQLLSSGVSLDQAGEKLASALRRLADEPKAASKAIEALTTWKVKATFLGQLGLFDAFLEELRSTPLCEPLITAGLMPSNGEDKPAVKDEEELNEDDLMDEL